MSRTADAAPNTAYSLSANALLGPGGTELELAVSSASAPIPDRLEKVQVKMWPLGTGDVEVLNLFDVPAPNGAASLPLGRLARLQHVQVRVHVKNGSQNVLDADTLVQYRALVRYRRIIRSRQRPLRRCCGTGAMHSTRRPRRCSS